jgi:hypothetical protein
MIEYEGTNAGTQVVCTCGNAVAVPAVLAKEPVKARPPVNAIVAGAGVALCPLCGVRNYFKKHNLGTIKRCSNCGQRLMLNKWKSCLLVVLALAASAIGAGVALAATR